MNNIWFNKIFVFLIKNYIYPKLVMTTNAQKDGKVAINPQKNPTIKWGITSKKTPKNK